MTETTTPNKPRGNLVLGLVLGSIVGIMVIALAWTLLIPQQSATPSPTRTTGTPAPTATTPSPTPSRTPSPTATPTASPSPSAHPDVVVSLPPGSWITVLDSLSKDSTDAEEALARASELGNDQHRAVVIDTDEIPGLNEGYYAVVVIGQESRDESNQVCEDLAIPLGDDCYPRQVQG